MKQFLVKELSKIYSSIKPKVKRTSGIEIMTYKNATLSKEAFDELNTSDCRYEFSDKGLMLKYDKDNKILTILKAIPSVPNDDVMPDEIIGKEITDDMKKNYPDWA